MADISTLTVKVKSEGITKTTDELKGLEKAAAGGDTITNKLNVTIKQTNTTINKFGASLNTTTGEANKTSRSLEQLLRSVQGLSLLGSIVARGALTNFLLQTADAAIKLADSWTLMEAKLKIATGSMVKAAVAQEDIYNIALKLRVPMEGVAQLYTRLIPAIKEYGGTTEQASMVTERVAAALKISGATGAEAASVMLQFSQSMQAGRLNGAEFNAVAEGSPIILRAISAELGKTRGELKSMAAQGLLTTDVIIRALQNQGNAWSKMANEMPQTFESATVNLKTVFAKLLGELNQEFKVTENMAKLVNFLTNNLEIFTKIVGYATLALVTYTAGATAASLATRAFAVSAAASAAPIGIAAMATKGLSAAFALLAKNPLGIILSVLAVGGVALYDYFNKATESVEDYLIKIEKLGAGADGVKNITKELESQQSELAKSTAELEKFKAMKAKSYDSIQINSLNEKIKELTANIEDTKKKIEGTKAAIKDFGDTGATSLDKMNDGLKESVKLLKEQLAAGKKFSPEDIQLNTAKENLSRLGSDNEIARFGLTAKANQLKEEIKLLQEKIPLQEKVNDLGKKGGDIESSSEKQAKAFAELMADISATRLNNLQKEEEGVNKLTKSEQLLNDIFADSNKVYNAANDAQKLAIVLAVGENAEMERAILLHKEKVKSIDEYTKSTEDKIKKEEEFAKKLEETAQKYQEERRVLLEAQQSKLDDLNGVVKTEKATAELNLQRAKTNILIKEQRLETLKLKLLNEDLTPESWTKLTQEIEDASEEIKSLTGNLDVLYNNINIGERLDFKKMADNIGQTLTDALFQSFENGKSFASNLWKTVKNLFKEKLQVYIATTVSGLVQGNGLSGANGSGGGFGVGDLVNYGQKIWDGFQNGFDQYSIGSYAQDFASSGIGQFLGLNAGTSWAGAGAGTINNSGALLAHQGATTAAETGASSFAAGAQTAGTYAAWAAVVVNAVNSFTTGEGWGATVGAAIGTYILPGIGTVIGSYLGGLVDTFTGGGGGPKGGGSAFASTGNATTSDRTYRLYTPDQADQDLSKALEGVTKGYEAAIKQFGGKVQDFIFGIGFDIDNIGDAGKRITSQLIAQSQAGAPKTYENLNQQVDGELGPALQLEAQKLILAALKESNLPQQYAEVLNSVTDISKLTEEQVKSVMDGLSAVKLMSESFDELGKTFPQLANLAWDSKKAIIGVSGGFEKYISNLKDYQELYYNDNEKTSQAFGKLKEVFDSLNVVVPKSKEAFRALVEKQDLTTESGQKTYATLLSIAGAFSQLSEAILDSRNILGDFAKAAVGTVEDFARQLASSVLGASNATEAGDAFATAFQEGFQNRIVNFVTDQVSKIVFDQILVPMLAGSLTANGLSTALTNMNNKILELTNVLNDPANQAMFAGLVEGARQLGKTLYDALKPTIDATGGNSVKPEKTTETTSSTNNNDAQKTAEDIANRRFELEVQLLRAQGKELEALNKERNKEIEALMKLDPSLVGIQKQIWALNDASEAANKTFDLSIRLYEALGMNDLVRSIRQSKELAAATSEVDKNLLRTIHTFENTAAALEKTNMIKSQEATIAEMLGDKEEALRLRREVELSTLNPLLIAGQKRIYQLEDEKAALDKAADKWQKAISMMNEHLKATTDIRKGIGSDILALKKINPAFDSIGEAAGRIASGWDGLTRVSSFDDAATKVDDLRQAILDKYEAEREQLEKNRTLQNESFEKQKQNAEELNKAYISLGEYAKSLLLGDKSPLGNQAKLAEAEKQYNEVVAAALAGDATAAGKVQQSSESYLDIARIFFGSTSAYADIFNRVQGQAAAFGGMARDPALVTSEWVMKGVLQDTTWQAKNTELANGAILELQKIDAGVAAYQATVIAENEKLVAYAVSDNQLLANIASGFENLPDNIARAIQGAVTTAIANGNAQLIPILNDINTKQGATVNAIATYGGATVDGVSQVATNQISASVEAAAISAGTNPRGELGRNELFFR